MDDWVHIALTGIGATLGVDAWAVVRTRWLGVPAPDFGMLGRWFGHMPRGRFRHASMAVVPPVRGERLIGWIAHYAIGVAFAVLLVLLFPDWLGAPTLGPALAFGIVTVLAPFLLMQPAMGAGIAASRMPRPQRARLHSVLTHAMFGVGLYFAGWTTHLLRLP